MILEKIEATFSRARTPNRTRADRGVYVTMQYAIQNFLSFRPNRISTRGETSEITNEVRGVLYNNIDNKNKTVNGTWLRRMPA